MSRLVEVDKLTEEQVRAWVEGPLSEWAKAKCRLEIAYDDNEDRLMAEVYFGDRPETEGWGPLHDTGQAARDDAARDAIYEILGDEQDLSIRAIHVPGPSPSPGGFSDSHRMTVTIDGRHYDVTAIEVEVQGAGTKEAEKSDEWPHGDTQPH
jgi:hypothetical protein